MSVTKRVNFLKFVNEFKASVVWKTIISQNIGRAHWPYEPSSKIIGGV